MPAIAIGLNDRMMKYEEIITKSEAILLTLEF